MTKKVPEHIKNNFIYRRIWNNIYRKDKNSILLIIGQPGTGKSTVGLKIASDLDSGFNVDRVVFSVKEFIRLIRKGNLKPGSVILFDEIAGSEDAADSRSAMSRTNKLMSFVSTTFRVKRYIIIYCSPFLMQIDANVRRIGVTAIIETLNVDFNKKLTKAKFYWSMTNTRSGETYYPMPRIKDTKTGIRSMINRVHFPKPNDELVRQYKEVKDRFVDGNIARWDKTLADKELESRQLNTTEIYERAKRQLNELVIWDKNDNPKVGMGLLRFKLNLGIDVAKGLRQVLQADVDAKRLIPIRQTEESVLPI